MIELICNKKSVLTYMKPDPVIVEIHWEIISPSAVPSLVDSLLKFHQTITILSTQIIFL